MDRLHFKRIGPPGNLRSRLSGRRRKVARLKRRRHPGALAPGWQRDFLSGAGRKINGCLGSKRPRRPGIWNSRGLVQNFGTARTVFLSLRRVVRRAKDSCTRPWRGPGRRRLLIRNRQLGRQAQTLTSRHERSSSYSLEDAGPSGWTSGIRKTRVEKHDKPAKQELE